MPSNTSTVASSQMELNPFTNKAYSANYRTLQVLAQGLPVSQQIPRLLSTLQQHNVLVVVGETGGGKTTQLPKAILLADVAMTKSGGKKFVLTQNRRLAAQLVAERIAEEMDVRLGGTVGLRHRGRDSTSKLTHLEVITDGTLVAAAKSDPSLSAYGAIVIDEAHQHTIATDLLLGLLKELAVTRKDDLKIVIMSATIDAALFTNFFPGSALETVGGREHKVLVSYLTEAVDSDAAISTIVDTILQVHLKERAGNILVFASGVGDIQKIISQVSMAINEGPKRRFKESEMGPLVCYPLHATLSPEEQRAAVTSVAPGPRNGLTGRKVIVATNIAETSVTLTGVTHVIDSCRVKSKIWNPRNESWSLRELWVSKAVAKQRAGRAGRTREGMAWRMCTEVDFLKQLEDHSVPAILESDLLSECLHILKMGRSPLDFPFMVAPATETIVKALSILSQLGAVDARGQLTARGEEITKIPVDVYSATVLLSSSQFGCQEEILSLVSIIQASEGGSQLFVKATTLEMKKKLKEVKLKYCHPTGDHLTLFNIYMAWRSACLASTADDFVRENMLLGTVLKSADHTRKQLLTIFAKNKSWKSTRMFSNNPGYYFRMLLSLAAGNFLRVANRPSQSEPRDYIIVRNSTRVTLTKDTSVGTPSDLNEWVIYNEFSTESKFHIRLVSAIAPELLIFAAPEYWSDLEFLPNCHIKDRLIKVLANMTKMDESVVQGDMPKPTVATAQ